MSLIRIIFGVTFFALCASFPACTRTDEKPAGPAEKVTIAFSATTPAALARIAQAKGFFKQEGLAVTPHLNSYGKLALKEVLEGKADIATVAETPVMFAIMNGEKIAIIAGIQSCSTDNAIVARKDKGIAALGDLKGKTIAATLGTTSEFFLDAILTVNGISRKDVRVVDRQAEQMADVLAHGEIDAVSTFAPYVNYTQKKLGDRVVTFQDKDIYRSTFNVVATQEYLHKNSGKVTKVLRALSKAEDFVRENPAEAQKMVADFTGVELAIVRDIWADTSFAVTLDQSLILALEDEAAWAMKNGLAKAANVPNFLDFIYFDGLRSVKPGAVRILR